ISIPNDEIKSNLNNPLIELNSKEYDPKVSTPEVLEIGISQKDIQKLTDKRAFAISSGVLMSSSKDYVPAKIKHKDKIVEAKVRLKGDWVDHLTSSKWSLRISVKGDNTLFGMKELSIQHPVHRNYLGEWILQKAMRRESVIALDFDFIKVIINDRDFGIYAVEEHFDKRLVENNEFREGIIVKFDEDLRWANIQRNFKDITLPSTYYSSAIDSFQGNSIIKDDTKRTIFKKAFNLLERFRSGELPPNKVFDHKKMARFYALSDFLGGQHATVFHNLRFYYNPVTSLLEPIAFDAMGCTKINQLLFTQAFESEDISFDLDRTLFSDELFLNEYLSELERFSKKSYLEGLFIALRDDIKKKVNILNSEFSGNDFELLAMNDLMSNSLFIRNSLTPVKGVHAYLKSIDNKKMVLRIGNIQGLPIEITSISRNSFELFRPEKKTLLKGKLTAEPVKYQDITFRTVGAFDLNEKHISELALEYTVVNTSIKNQQSIVPWSLYDNSFLETDFIRQEPNVKDFPFFVVNENEKIIFIKPGNVPLDRNLIIPKGYTVVSPNGVTINLVNGAKIISYSPLKFVGTEDAPIVIQSHDRTGQGIAVLNAEKQSILSYVHFNNLSAPKEEGWELTGSVTFYQSPVRISNCQFMLNHDSDDALNIVRSNFEIRDSHFAQTFADAIDLDFSDGAMYNLSFKNAGNDGIDASGSYVNIFDVIIDEAGDKGISVGEGSTILAMNVQVNRANIGFASKDTSSLLLNNGSISNSKIGFAVYQKKPEFGPAKIEAKSIKLENVDKPYLIQKGSQLLFDNTLIKETP
ncbi:MAG: CotH kinase family protein, partial [Candidatus Omnitrophica bacterium]|nr:CotH kinase family protein [Candidatus Omnitrophota bacterium]